MAAISTTVSPGAFEILRNVSAQASTGQTDILLVPAWANYCHIVYNLTAQAGTTPGPSALTIQAYDPVLLDTTEFMALGQMTAPTSLTSPVMIVVDIGPGVTGIADDVTNAAAADSYLKINAVLPAILGIKVLNSRTDGDETYTYTLSVEFRG